jgi:F-type H+-transporting ATPase subunit gamma
MQTLEALRKSIATAGELYSVVRTMKGMAAAGIRRFERAVESLADYTRAVELAFQVLMSERPEGVIPAAGAPGEGGLGAIVFGSDQGMCGRFNSEIAAHVSAELREMGTDAGSRTVLVVGTRVVPFLEAFGVGTDDEVAPATSLAGVGPLVSEILGKVLEWWTEGSAEKVLVFYNEALGGSSFRPATIQLLPVDVDWLRGLALREWPSRAIPVHTEDWDGMFGALVREQIYIAIFRAAAESLASENASRLASMQAAERNIEEHLDELNQKYRRERQQAITEELLDIVSGFEALSE